MELVFILQKPRVPENIGASARAICTMGFDQLRLIQPQSHLRDRCRWVAANATSVLDNAGIYDTLEEAAEDLDLIIGTTAKERRAYYDYHTPQQLADYLTQKSMTCKKVGILFGPEDSGLANEDLEYCDILTSIPANNEYGALNLSQAVMIYAYELRELSVKNRHPGKRKPEGDLSHKVFKEKLTELFGFIDINKDDVKVKRVFEKASHLSDEDLRLIHYIRKKILFKVDREHWRRGR